MDKDCRLGNRNAKVRKSYSYLPLVPPRSEVCLQLALVELRSPADIRIRDGQIKRFSHYEIRIRGKAADGIGSIWTSKGANRSFSHIAEHARGGCGICEHM